MTCITKTHLFLLMFPFLLVSSKRKESELEAMFQKEIQELQMKMCGKIMFKLLEKYTLLLIKKNKLIQLLLSLT